MRDTFYITGGTLPLNADSYVTRDADTVLLEAMRQGEFCYVLNTRQIGKSSLMVRTAQALRQQAVRVAVLDLNAIGQNVSVEAWYDGLLTLIAEQLRLEDELEAFWRRHSRLSPMQRWMMALRHIVLQDARPLCIFVDEIDAVRGLPFSTDEFFAGIRECYNRRAQDNAFARLTFCLLGVATPTDLIRDPRTTPFNIGTRIELTDFTFQEAAPLTGGLRRGQHGEGEGQAEAGQEKEGKGKGKGQDVSSSFTLGVRPQEGAQIGRPSGGKDIEGKNTAWKNTNLDRILYWTDGHPYLTQKFCQALAERGGTSAMSMEALTRRDVDDVCEALFLSKRAELTDDNLAFVRSRLLHGDVDRAALLDLYRQLLLGRKFRDDVTNPLHNVLRLSGVVKVTAGQMRVRNRIYAHVFGRQWAEDNMPGEEVRRQKAAYRRGVARTAGLSGAIVVVIAGLAGVAWDRAHVAQIAETRATDQQRIATQRLSRSYVDTGTRLMEQEDCGGALAPLVEAMALDQNDRARTRMHRMRFASALACAPHLDRMWFTDKPLRWAGFSPDKTRVAACGDDGRAHVWQADTGDELALEMKHDGSVTYAAFSPDGARLATCGRDNFVRVWDLNARRLLCALPNPRQPNGPEGITQAAWSHDGRRLAACSKGVLRVWDVHEARAQTQSAAPRAAQDGLQGAKLIFENHANAAEKNALFDAVAFSPDNARIALVAENYVATTASIRQAGSGGSAGIYELGNLVKDETPKKTGTSWHGSHVAYSANGRRLLLAGSFGGFSQQQGVGVYDLAPAPLTAAASLPAPRLFHRSLLLAHDSLGTYAAFSPDEKQIVTAGEDSAARVWDAQTGRALTPPLRHQGTVTQAAFSPDGQRVLTASLDGTARVWNAQTGQQIGSPLRHAGAVVSAQWAGDGSHVLTAGSDGSARLWTLAPLAPSAVQIANTSCHLEPVAGTNRIAVKTQTQGQSEQGYISDLATGARLFPPADTGPWHDLQMSANHRLVILYHGSKRLPDGMQVWDCERGQPISPLLPDADATLNHRGDLLLLRDKKNGMARILDVATGKTVGTPFYSAIRFFSNGVEDTPFTRDDRGVAVCDRANNVLIRDVRAGRALTPLMPHRSPVEAVRFTPNDRYLFTGTIDYQIQAWNIPAGTPASAALPPPGAPIMSEAMGTSQYLHSAVFSPDGRWALTSPLTLPSPLLWPLDGSSMLRPRAVGHREVFLTDDDIVSSLHSFSADSGLLVAMETGGRIARVSDLAFPPLTPTHGARITGIQFSPDSRRVVSASLDGTARVWDVQTMQPLTPPLRHGGAVKTALFSPDGCVVATGSEGSSARAWDSATGEAITPPLALRGRISHLHWTPDGRRLLATSDQEGRVWTLPNETGSLPYLRAQAQLLSGQRYADGIGMMPLDNAALRMAWQQVQAAQEQRPAKSPR